MKARLNMIAQAAAILLLSLSGGCAPQHQDDGLFRNQAAAAEQPVVLASWPIVNVLTHTAEGKKVGYGAVIGDGTLVVTTYHLTHEESIIGIHHVKGMITVMSPYLGDIRIGTLVIADRELDLAVLAVPWRGHPAFELAPSEEVSAAERAVALSIGQLGEQDQDAARAAVRREDLQIDSVTFRGKLMMYLSLADIQQIGEGWSGSPILSMTSGHLMGCFTSIQGDRSKLRYSGNGLPNPRRKRLGLALAAPAIAQAVSKDRVLNSLAPANRPADATDANEYLHRAIRARAAGTDLSAAIGAMKEFLKRRPDSDAAKLMLGSWQETSGNVAEAETVYKTAIEASPGNLDICETYAQFMANNGRFKEALGQYDLAHRAGVDDGGLLDCLVVQTLLEMPQTEAAVQRANKAIDRYPQNARLFSLRGLGRFEQGNRDGAISDLRLAVSLWPENLDLRHVLSKFLRQAGQLSDAEVHLRDAIDLAPEDPVGYVELAAVLMQQSPDHRAEAKEILERAQKLNVPARLSQTIEQMLKKLRVSGM